jgi:hypothetical protein
VLWTLLLTSVNAGRLGEDALGLIEEGGVTELYEAVSRVDEDFPEVMSPLDWDSSSLKSLDLLVWKLALERRRNGLKNGIL